MGQVIPFRPSRPPAFDDDELQQIWEAYAAAARVEAAILTSVNSTEADRTFARSTADHARQMFATAFERAAR